MTIGTPFLVLALPRSRTAWLSRFLSYGPWTCWHEQARYVRDVSDVRSWLSQSFTGAAETTGARWWRLINAIRPDARIVIIRRPIKEVIDSVLRIDLGGGKAFDRGRLTVALQRVDRALDEIERRLAPLSVEFHALENEDICQRVFEHCLEMPHDHEWWQSLAPINVQCDFRALMRYVGAFSPQMSAAGRRCLHETRRLVRPESCRVTVLAEQEDGITIRQEPWPIFWKDGVDLFREHCKAVGEQEDEYLRKNMYIAGVLDYTNRWHVVTARCNGRMLGYLVSIIAPSIESERVTTATQTTFFVSKDAKSSRLGLRLQRASIAALRARGINEIYMRAGVRGNGPYLDALYRRVGAKEFGALYKLPLEGAIETLREART
jgi:hypothetical protein